MWFITTLDRGDLDCDKLTTVVLPEIDNVVMFTGIERASNSSLGQGLRAFDLEHPRSYTVRILGYNGSIFDTSESGEKVSERRCLYPKLGLSNWLITKHGERIVF